MIEHISPDGKWKILIKEKAPVKWIELTKKPPQFTIEEIVEATKRILPKIW